MTPTRILDEITPAQRKALAGGRTPEIRKSGLASSNLATWSIEDLQRELWRNYSAVKQGVASEKNAVLVFGDQGSGKSEVVQSFAKSVAKLYPDKKFLHFTDPDAVKNKTELIKNPSPYFIFLDLRAAQLAEHQVGGVPNLPRSEIEGYLVWSPTDWTALVTNPEFVGYIFLDEVNRADQAVINSLFGLVLDRMISGRKLSKNCFVAAAANLGSKFAGTTDLDPAFFGRFNVGYLVPNRDEWAAWAQKNGIEQAIIDFVQSAPEATPDKNFIRNYPGGNKQTVNPRNLQKASDNLKWMHYVYDNAIEAAAKDGIQNPNRKQIIPYLQKFNVPGTGIQAVTGDVYKDYYDSIVTRCGTEWTNDFMMYLRNIDEFEEEEVFDKLEKGYWKQKSGAKRAEELDTGKLYYLTRFITDTLFNNFVAAKKSGNKEDLDKVVYRLATALGGLDAEQISFVLDRFIAHVKNMSTTGKDLGQEAFATALVQLFAAAHASLKQRNKPEAVKAVADWIKTNMAAKIPGQALIESFSPKAMFNSLIVQNTRTSFKPKFKTFYNLK